MTLFAEKGVFKLLGLQAIQPSPLLTSQDCIICTRPLATQPNPAQEGISQSKLHAAVRITTCGHIVGEECLDAWLDTGNTCPICKRELFDAKGDAITQQDVDRVIQSLSQYHGIYRVRASISRVMRRLGREYIPPKQVRGGGVSDDQNEKDNFGYSDGEGWGSDEEMEFDEEEDDDEDMELDELDEEYAELDEQDESKDEELKGCDDAEGQEEEKKETNTTGSEE